MAGLLRLAALTSVCIESEENSAHRPGLNSFLFMHSNLFDEAVFQQQSLIYKGLIAELRPAEEWLLLSSPFQWHHCKDAKRTMHLFKSKWRIILHQAFQSRFTFRIPHPHVALVNFVTLSRV